MEDENLGMGMFDNLELNYDGFPTDDSQIEDQESNDLDPNEINNTNIDTVEDDNPGEVDSEDSLDEGNDDEGAESSSNLFSSLATVLHEQGLLPSLDLSKSKVETVDDFTEAFKKELEIQTNISLENYIANLDVSSIANSKKLISDYNSIDESTLRDNSDMAKQLIYQDYLNQGLDEKKANRLLTRLVDLGEDAIIEDALESLDSLKEYQSRKIEFEKESYAKNIELQKEEQAKLDADLKRTIFDTKDLITGFKPTKALQDKVYKTINEVVGKSPDGVYENKFMRDRRINPLEFESRMYYFYELTNGFKDYSKLTTGLKSNAVKDLERVARRTNIVDNGAPLWAQDSNSYDSNLGSILNI